MDIQEVKINHKLKTVFGDYFVLGRSETNNNFFVVPDELCNIGAVRGKVVYPYPRWVQIACDHLVEMVTHTKIFCRVVDNEIFGVLVKDKNSYLDDGPPMPIMVQDPHSGEYVPLLTEEELTTNG